MLAKTAHVRFASLHGLIAVEPLRLQLSVYRVNVIQKQSIVYWRHDKLHTNTGVQVACHSIVMTPSG